MTAVLVLTLALSCAVLAGMVIDLRAERDDWERAVAEWIEAHDQLVCELSDECRRYDELADRIERYMASNRPARTETERLLRAQAGRN